MKRVAIFLILVFTISIISAMPEITFENENFQPGETILARISGPTENTISSKDLKFYEGRKETSFEKEIISYNGNYYIYAYINREGNFTLKIEDILYKSDEELKETSFEKNFEVKTNYIISEEEKINETTNETYFENKTDTEILSIKPGFFFGIGNPKITLTNKGTKILEVSYLENELILEPQDSEIILLSPTETFSFLNISTYKEFAIPIIVLDLNKTEKPQESNLKFSESLLHFNLIAGQSQENILEIFNFGDTNITDLSAKLSSTKFEITELENVLPARTTQNLTIKTATESEGYFEENLTISYVEDHQEKKQQVTLILFVLSSNATSEDFEVQEESCSQLMGTVCQANERCEGQATFTSEGYCCIGNCVSYKDEESEGNGWIIGVGIFILLGIMGFFIYKRFKKVKPQKPEDRMAETSKRFQRRIRGGLSRS